MNPKNTKLTIEVPIVLHTALKTLAARKRTTVKAILIRGAISQLEPDEYVESELAQPTATQDTRTVYAADGDG